MNSVNTSPQRSPPFPKKQIERIKKLPLIKNPPLNVGARKKTDSSLDNKRQPKSEAAKQRRSISINIGKLVSQQKQLEIDPKFDFKLSNLQEEGKNVEESQETSKCRLSLSPYVLKQRKGVKTISIGKNVSNNIKQIEQNLQTKERQLIDNYFENPKYQSQLLKNKRKSITSSDQVIETVHKKETEYTEYQEYVKNKEMFKQYSALNCKIQAEKDLALEKKREEIIKGELFDRIINSKPLNSQNRFVFEKKGRFLNKNDQKSKIFPFSNNQKQSNINVIENKIEKQQINSPQILEISMISSNNIKPKILINRQYLRNHQILLSQGSQNSFDLNRSLPNDYENKILDETVGQFNHIINASAYNDMNDQSQIINIPSLLEDNYLSLYNFEISSLIHKDKYIWNYILRNILTKQFHLSKRVYFVSLEAETGFDNEQGALSYFFDQNGNGKSQFLSYPGIFKIMNPISSEKLEKEGLFIFPNSMAYESLAKSLIEMRLETLNGEAVCRLYQTNLHKSLSTHQHIFIDLIVQIAEVIDLLSQHGYAHGSIKMENILIQPLHLGDSSSFQDLRIHNFSSAFSVLSSGLSRITPEYMPPEILQAIQGKNSSKSFVSPNTPWSIDIWGLGCIILEILTMVPVWIPHKSIVHFYGCDQKKITEGIFSHPQRRIDLICNKQLKFCNQIEVNIKQLQNNWNPSLPKPSQAIQDILVGIFQIEGSKRISPKQIIQKLRFP